MLPVGVPGLELEEKDGLFELEFVLCGEFVFDAGGIGNVAVVVAVGGEWVEEACPDDEDVEEDLPLLLGGVVVSCGIDTFITPLLSFKFVCSKAASKSRRAARLRGHVFSCTQFRIRSVS